MKIGIIGAMVEEVDLVKAEMEITKEDIIGTRHYLSGKFQGKDVVLVFSKCGKVAVAVTAITLIERFGVNMIIFTGVAGAAASGLHVGDIVIADKLVQHDMDVCALPGYQKFEIPMLGRSYFEADPQQVALAKESALNYLRDNMRREIRDELLAEFKMSNPQIVVGTIASGDQFVADKQRIKYLLENVDNLQCVEMEGAALAQVCYEYELPCIIVRVMSDNADDVAHINFRKFVQETASFMTRGIIRKLVERF